MDENETEPDEEPTDEDHNEEQGAGYHSDSNASTWSSFEEMGEETDEGDPQSMADEE